MLDIWLYSGYVDWMWVGGKKEGSEYDCRIEGWEVDTLFTEVGGLSRRGLRGKGKDLV